MSCREAARDLILAGAILSILVNPLLIEGLVRAVAWRKARSEVPAAEVQPEEEEREPLPVTKLKNHVVLVGHGRVGSVVSEALRKSRTPLLIIENDEDAAAELRKQHIDAIAGNAADPEIMKAANLAEACCLLVAIPDAFEGGQVVEQARAANANLLIVARAHSDEEVAHLAAHGASDVVMGEFEIAKAMIEDVRRLELPEPEESKEEAAAKGSAHLAEAPSTA